MFSSSTGVMPKSLQDQQLQCDELLTRLDIDLELSNEEKLASLRDLPHHKLVQAQICGCSKSLPAGYSNWEDFFGRVYANIQVHHLQRGFHNALFAGGLEAGKDVFRYRFERRLDCVAEKIPPEWGVTHLTDIPVWLWGCGYVRGLNDQEKKWLKGWNESLAAFVNGDEVDWGTKNPRDMRRWRSDGETDVWDDDVWEDGVEFWRLVNLGLEGAEGKANH